jgi:Mitochondrial K+-H+ exchange-related
VDVFLVPVATERYELYCEEPDEPDEPDTEPRGVFRRMAHRVREILAEAERDRHAAHPEPGGARPGMFARLKARTLRWAAAWIAEQRLLWQLRSKVAVCLVYPADTTEPQARQLLKRSLQRDWERHRFWLVIDSVGLVGSAALILLPGPNVLGYYFLVRTVGHYFSLRGARQGLTAVEWSVQPSPELAALRPLVDQPPEVREDRVREIAGALRLEHFARFFQHSATP